MNSKRIRLAHFTNISSHYQISLGQSFANKLGNEFVQVCMESGHDERRKLGWEQNFSEEWLIRAWISPSEKARALDIFHSADLVIWAYVPVNEVNTRVTKGKLTFLYSERIFKRGKWRVLDLRVLKSLIVKFAYNNRKNHHMLSVGPYCAEDYSFLGLFKGRTWRWGYFPEQSKVEECRKFDDPPIILWAGRMLPWKRVDLLLRAAAWARARGDKTFQLMLIGAGTEEERLRSLSVSLGLSDICKFHGPQSPDKVGKAMESSFIYVLPSNQQEGWGVVVNEAMSRGCCVIGSRSAGSIPWLIQDGVNGYVFSNESVEVLGQKLRWCLENPYQTRQMGLAAQTTIERLWSPDVAADRFLRLCTAIENGKSAPFEDEGPCSPLF